MKYCTSKISWQIVWWWPIYSWSNSFIYAYQWDEWVLYYINAQKNYIDKYIKDTYKDCYIQNIKDIFWIDINNEKLYGIYPKETEKRNELIIWVSNSSSRIYNKVIDKFFNSKLYEYFLPIVTDKWLLIIVLKEDKEWLEIASATTLWEAIKKENKYIINWSTQIDNFLVKYCATKFFGWNSNKAIKALINKQRSSCWLWELNMDCNWNKEMTLIINDPIFWKKSLIYSDIFNEKTNTRIIKQIFITPDRIFKFLKSYDWCYSEFLTTK